jgi:hypothetical protein
MTAVRDPQTIGRPANIGALTDALVKYLRPLVQQLNGISSGSINSFTTAATAPPAAGSVTLYAAGDYIRNTAPSVLGSAGSQYVIKGWICVAGGKPGTWVQDRGLTGT